RETARRCVAHQGLVYLHVAITFFIPPRSASLLLSVPTFGAGVVSLQHEGPRSESSNNAHEPTNGRSTHYGGGHLIRVFRDIGHIFSSPYPFIGGSFLSRFAQSQGLVTLRQTFVRRSHARGLMLIPRTIQSTEQRPACLEGSFLAEANPTVAA